MPAVAAGKVEETKKTLELVNKEIEWHTKNPSPIEEDIHLLETLTSFRDRLTEWLEGFTKDLKEATQMFKELCTQFGEENVKVCRERGRGVRQCAHSACFAAGAC